MSAPLEAFPSARLAEIVGVAFDVDDTITRHGRLEHEAFAALWALRAAGLHLIAATGRPLGWAEVYAWQWPVQAAVGENGAGWRFRVGERIERAWAAPEDLARRAEIRAAVARALPQWPETDDAGARERDLAWDVGERRVASAEERARFHEVAAELAAPVTISSVHAHAAPGTWDKATGIRAAARDALGVELDPARWIFVGDSGNDAPAFALFAETSVAVANADLAALGVAPAYVTTSPRGRGFAELARRLLDARRR